MIESHSRRAFLHRVAGLAVLGLGGCGPERREAGADGAGAARDPESPAGAGTNAPPEERAWRARVEARPILRPYGADAVRIATPLDVLPVAYVSMAGRQVFVDRDYRDRAAWLLDAHISVSTWVWRIPLPGDSPRTPIPPGNEPREFEEPAIGLWDPSMEPRPGDVRIVLGRREPAVLAFDCLPVQATHHRISAEPLEVQRCRAGEGEPVREDFKRLAEARRHADAECGDEGATVEVFGWACR